MRKFIWDALSEIYLWFRRYLIKRPVFIIFSAYLVILLTLKAAGKFDEPGSLDPSRYAGQKLILTGIVSGQPDRRPAGTIYFIQAETVRIFDSDLTQSVAGQVYLQVSGEKYFSANPMDRVKIFGKLSIPQKKNIPGVFDYYAYLRAHGIFCQMFAGTHSIENLGPSRQNSLPRWTWKIHQEIVGIFSRYLDSSSAAVLAGLAVGDRPRFHPEIKRIFVESGTMHILVASGSNVAFVVGIWFLIIRIFFRFPRRWAVLSSFPAIWFYVFLVGNDPPIFRAGVMASVGILAYILAREDRAFHSLALAALTILIINPRTLFDIGFQMSFITVFGLIYSLPKIQPLLLNLPSLIKWPALMAASTLTAQIWLWPVTASIFRKFYPISLVANIFIIPLAAGGLLTGLILLIFHWVHFHLLFIPHLLSFIQFLSSAYLRFLIALVRFFADHPGKIFWVAPCSSVWSAGFFLALISLGGLKRLKSARIGLVLALALMGTASFHQRESIHRNKGLTVTWLRAGQLYPVLFEYEKTKFVFISGDKDLGQNLEKTIIPFLSERRISKLDAVLFMRPPENSALTEEMFKKEIAVRKFITPSEANRFFAVPPFSIESFPDIRNSEIPFLIERRHLHILLSHYLPIKIQESISKKPITLEVVQSCFSSKQKWDQEFLKKFRPVILVDVGKGRNQAGNSIWKDGNPVSLQKRAWFEWKEN